MTPGYMFICSFTEGLHEISDITPTVDPAPTGNFHLSHTGLGGFMTPVHSPFHRWKSGVSVGLDLKPLLPPSPCN